MTYLNIVTKEVHNRICIQVSLLYYTITQKIFPSAQPSYVEA